MKDTVLKVEMWAKEKGLLKKENSQAQMCKVMEEVGETASALLKGKEDEFKDGIGDIMVTIIILAAQNGLSIEECLDAAWEEIKGRTGKLVDGVFVKD